MTACPTPAEFHTAHLTLLGSIAYGTPLPLWRLIPQRWVRRRCRKRRTPTYMASADQMAGYREMGAAPRPCLDRDET